jgi:ATPase subunit of ABC transporter with duplicated ATPase domains
VISHDEQFLNQVATHVLDVDYGTVTLYTGNYQAFAREKAEVRARKEAEVERAEATIAEKRAWVERFGAKATKARQAQSRLKQLERIEVEELAQTNRRTPSFSFTPQRPSGRDVLELSGISKAYGEKSVLREVSLTVRRGERVAIIGPNGLGKSTLLKIATQNLAADAGRVAWGYETHVGYFAQDHHDVLERPDATPLELIDQALPLEGPSVVRGHLGRVLFSGDDVHKPVSALSGGEAARLVFCRIMVQRPNVLVLDEPTNHLDLEAIHALVKGLLAFDGTLLFVSHDRAFVSALATRVVEVQPGGISDFPGTYADYLARAGDDHLSADAVVLRAKQERAAAAASVAREPTWEENKRRANRRKQLPGLRDRALEAIAAAEARKAEISAGFCEPGFFERTPRETVAALEAEERALGPRIEELMAEWEALEAELAADG